MTKVISQHSDLWTLRKIHLFEELYGEFIKEGMHGQIDDMELVEWEGEMATLERLQKKLASCAATAPLIPPAFS